MKKGKYKLVKESAAKLNIREEDQLLLQYPDKDAVIDQLSEIPVNLQTYEFLGELFFNYTFRALGEHPPSDQWKAQLRTIRNDVYQLFELARAAKALKQVNSSAQQD
jgi:hypothetical protein